MSDHDDLSLKEKLVSVLLLKGDRMNRTDFFVLASPLLLIAVTFLLLNEYASVHFWSLTDREFVSADEKSQAFDQYRLRRKILENVSIPIYLFTGFYLISLMSKRLHDMGRSSRLCWAIILAVVATVNSALLRLVMAFFMFASLGFFAILVPFFVYIVYLLTFIGLIQMFLLPGTKGENKYGEYFEIFPNPLRKIIGDKIKFFE